MTKNSPHQRLLNISLASSPPRRQNIGRITHHQSDSFPTCTKETRTVIQGELPSRPQLLPGLAVIGKTSLYSGKGVEAAWLKPLPSSLGHDQENSDLQHQILTGDQPQEKVSPTFSKSVRSSTWPSTGCSSIFQSPVWTMVPWSLRRMRPQQSGIECVTLMGSQLHRKPKNLKSAQQ